MSVTDEQARAIVSKGDVHVFPCAVGDLAADLLDARAKINSLRATLDSMKDLVTKCNQDTDQYVSDRMAAERNADSLRAALRDVCDNAEAIAVRMNKMAIDQGCDCQDSCICGLPDTLRELAAFKCALAAARKQMGEK